MHIRSRLAIRSQLMQNGNTAKAQLVSTEDILVGYGQRSTHWLSLCTNIRLKVIEWVNWVILRTMNCRCYIQPSSESPSYSGLGWQFLRLHTLQRPLPQNDHSDIQNGSSGMRKKYWRSGARSYGIRAKIPKHRRSNDLTKHFIFRSEIQKTFIYIYGKLTT